MSIDSRVSTGQVQKAIKSLVTYAEKKKKQVAEEGKTLFADEDENVWLVITTKLMSPQLTLKPQRVPLVHPIVDPRTSPICLITKDPQRAYKDLLQKNGINFISRVVDISKLKGKWAPFEARRQLAGDYGLFLADERVIPLLPRLLGKVFFKKKKQPIPVNLLKKDLKSELEAAISSTYLHQNAGTCTSIKIAHTGMPLSKIQANAEKAIPVAVLKLHTVNKKRKKGEEKEKGKKVETEEDKKRNQEDAWENIQSLGLKTHSSICLPIWSCNLEERWTIPTSASASTSTGISASKSDGLSAPLNGVSKPGSKSAKASAPKDVIMQDEEDDTMSEGDEEERKLSEKMKKSSLSSEAKPKSKSKTSSKADKVVSDGVDKPDGKKKKRKAEEVPELSTPAKKTKTDSSSTVAEGKSKAKADKTLDGKKQEKKKDSTSSKVDISEGKKDGNKKLDRAKAVDFMDESLDHAVPSSSDKKVKEGTKVKEAKDKKEKKKDKKDALVVNNTPSTPAVPIKASKPTTTPAPAPVSAATPTSTPSSSAPTSTVTKPLKSALKKPGADTNLSASELKEKKAKRASFSVVEKKKEKLTKGVVSGKSSKGKAGSAGKSGSGGKSKKGMVGRGPKM